MTLTISFTNKYLLKLYGMDKVASKPNLQKKNSEEPIKNVVSHRSKSVLTDENFKRTKPKVNQFFILFCK